MASYKTPPVFSEAKPYARWIEEVKAWQEVTALAKEKHGLAIALTLPEQGAKSIRDKVFSEVSIDELKKDTGVATLIKFMDNVFKKDELSAAYEAYTVFDRYRKPTETTMEEFVIEFEKLYNKTKKYQMELPQPVLAFKLLESAQLEHKDRQLVLTAVDYKKPDKMFEQMQTSLKKFFGQQSMPSGKTRDEMDVKIEPVLMTKQEGAFYTGRGGYRGNGRGRYGTGQPERRNNYRRGQGSRGSGWNQRGMPKKLNPLGPDGYPLKCSSCESIRHLLKDCPDSYENMQKKVLMSDSKEEEAVLFTGNKQQETQVLMSEALGAAILDSACSSTVAGQSWMTCYLDMLEEERKMDVTRSKSNAVFRFGGGERLKSMEKVTIPCEIAGVRCKLTTDVVDRDIPLLLGKPAMKKAKVKLDLENDCATIFGKTVDLQCTSSGHYCIPIVETTMPVGDTVEALLSEDEKSAEENRKKIEKLHKQFAHPTAQKLKYLLKDANVSDEGILDLVDEVVSKCETCKRYKKTPPRPVVGLPIAKEFNEVVALDLKEWKSGVYFLHIIDVATRFSVAGVIRNKTPKVIIDKVMKLWIGSGMGAPRKFLSDNGGEFANEQFRDMAENLSIEVWNTAGSSPWQNGLCERNHAVVDNCVQKILEDYPNMDLELALVWAVNAKNSLQMVYGYSPYQLVFGRNPNLPSVLTDQAPALHGTTVSDVFAKHLNALHSSRKAFIQAEASEKIRRALRHKIRSSSEVFQPGDKVFYKRDESNKWKGPGKVLGQDGKVVFVRHGNIYVRVHPCRLIRVGEEFHNSQKRDHRQEIQNEGDHDQSQIDQFKSGVTDKPLQQVAEEDDDADITPDGLEDAEEGEPSSPQNEVNQRKSIRSSQQLPKVKQNITYLPTGGSTWIECEVVQRSGKATGKYRNWFYVKEKGDDASLKELDFEKDVQDWKVVENNSTERDESGASEEANAVFIPLQRHDEPEVRVAKEEELASWKKFQVYEELEDCGQQTISTRWVVTEKSVDGKRVITKARLVARGFEEQKSVQADSPTVSKETMKVFLALASTLSWKCHSIDVKAAFLQGNEINREMFLRPPKEAGVPGKVWKLKKCVYGLNDASRNWYFSVRDELIKHGCSRSEVDLALFFWHHEEKLSGMFILHVDDFLWAGTEDFQRTVVDRVKSAFKIGKEAEGAFRYIGLEIAHGKDGIMLTQDPYIDSLSEIPVPAKRVAQKEYLLKQSEVTELRGAIGQVQWASNQTRPDISYDALELSTAIREPKVKDLLQANKVIKRLKSKKSNILFPDLGDIKQLRLTVFCDASYANLTDGVSSAGGHIVFLTGKDNRSCPLSWRSGKIRRVVRSTLAAEALSMADSLDSAYCLGYLLSEMVFNKPKKNRVPIKVCTDNKSLFENIHSTKAVSEKRLRVEIGSIKEMLHKGELSSVKWIESSAQISNCLTKHGASCKELMDILQMGSLQNYGVPHQYPTKS